MLAHLRTFEGISQADPTCVAITWTQESFPLYPLRLLFNSESIICKLFWNDFKKHLCFFPQKLGSLSENLLFFFQWTFYLLLSCATFSSVDNVTECVDCVSGWTFFCPQNVSSVYKCLMCPYWTVPRCFQLCAKTGPLSKTQTTLKVQTMTDWPRNLYLISTFSNPSDSCQYEMLRPPVCSCSVPGECETSEDNVLEVWNLLMSHFLLVITYKHTISLEAV